MLFLCSLLTLDAFFNYMLHLLLLAFKDVNRNQAPQFLGAINRITFIIIINIVLLVFHHDFRVRRVESRFTQDRVHIVSQTVELQL